MAFALSELSRDRFLGGDLTIWQPKSGHRAGVDPVLLAASVPARTGQTVLDLGCGSGVVGLCLASRVAGLDVTGVELQSDYADLARLNARENRIEMRIATADVAELPVEIRQMTFDHVVANPPYYIRGHGTPARDPGRDSALAGGTPLAAWVDAATRRLKPGGMFSFVQKADRLKDLLQVMDARLGSIVVKPLAPRTGRTAELTIVRAKKGGRAAFRLLAPTILHQGSEHRRDGEDYAAEIREVLRSGAPLEFR